VAEIVYAAFMSPGHPVCDEILRTTADWLNRTIELVKEERGLTSQAKPPAG
jgi:hypothetical protein